MGADGNEVGEMDRSQLLGQGGECDFILHVVDTLGSLELESI